MGIITNVPFAPLLDLFVTRHATLHDLVLCLMLRYLIFLCGVGWGGVGIITNVPLAPLLDLFVTRHATLRDLVLCLMLRYLIFF